MQKGNIPFYIAILATAFLISISGLNALIEDFLPELFSTEDPLAILLGVVLGGFNIYLAFRSRRVEELSGLVKYMREPDHMAERAELIVGIAIDCPNLLEGYAKPDETLQGHIETIYQHLINYLELEGEMEDE